VRKTLQGRSFASAEAQPQPDIAAFMRANMRLAPAPLLPEIRLYAAHPASGLRRLVGEGGEGEDPPPYWAYHWAGGTALARHILNAPELVRGLSVLDLGAGSGVVAIAAAKAGAREVVAADIETAAVVAIGLNAAANGVSIKAAKADFTAGAPPSFDVILVGDLFYEQALALRVTGFLDRCLERGVKALVGDPYRAHLPRERLRLIAEYPAPDFGDRIDAPAKLSGVFSFEARVPVGLSAP
jgi:predicted nicotinamide N-methyase